MDPKGKMFGTTAEFAGLSARLLHVGVGQVRKFSAVFSTAASCSCILSWKFRHRSTSDCEHLMFIFPLTPAKLLRGTPGVNSQVKLSPFACYVDPWAFLQGIFQSHFSLFSLARRHPGSWVFEGVAFVHIHIEIH